MSEITDVDERLAEITDVDERLAVAEITDVDERLASSIERKLSNKTLSSTGSCIFRVPEQLTQHGEDIFLPKFVSIGPFHRGKESLEALEELKLSYLQALLSQPPTPQTSLKEFIKAIREMEERARGCYAEKLQLSGDEFVEMMIVDGCFLIQLFRKNQEAEPRDINDPIFSTSWMYSSVWKDLIMLENQIPWFILECLFCLTMTSEEEESHSLVKLGLDFFEVLMPITVEPELDPRLETKHILDLLRNCMLPSSGDVKKPEIFYGEAIHPVSNLVGAGVKFKKGTRNNILNIKFGNGELEIPPLRIQKSTEHLYRNLIAYEQCSHLMPSRIASYVLLSDHLINSSRDVQLLRDEGILDNRLSSEEETPLLINRAWKGATIKEFYYVELYSQVNEFYRNRWHKWRAKLMQDYFNTPWSIISVTGAIVLLILTFIQTFFTIRN